MKLVVCNHATKKCSVALRCEHAKPHKAICLWMDETCHYCERPDGKCFYDAKCIPVKEKKCQK